MTEDDENQGGEEEAEVTAETEDLLEGHVDALQDNPDEKRTLQSEQEDDE